MEAAAGQIRGLGSAHGAERTHSFPVNMTTASTSKPYTSSDNLCSVSAEKVGQIRPKASLLNILHEAGASGETFTLKEVMHYLGQYIILKQLYNQQQQHIVHCENDDLGKVFGVQSFSVKDPSQLYEMLSRNLIAANFEDAAQTRTLVKESKCLPMREDHPKCPASGELGEETTAWNIPTSATSHLKRKNSESDESATDDPSEYQAKKFKTDSVSELWDAAGLPWWFIKNLRSNYGSRKSGSTDIHSNQDVDTAIVSDSTDDLWFLNEPASDQINVEIKLETIEPKEIAECEGQKGEEGKNIDRKEVTGVTIYEADADLPCSGDDTDTEISEVVEDSSDLKDSWKCSKCGECNPSPKQYCLRCWAFRKGWHLTCPKFVHSTSDPSIASFESTEHSEGIDVPDCRRSVSEPLIQTAELKCKEKGKHAQRGSSESFEGLLQPSTSTISLSESRKELESVEEAKTRYEESLHFQRNRLGPCLLCGVRPRTGNIIHGKTGHLVACYACAKMLYKRKLPCPVCAQPINTVIRTFIS